MELFDPSRFRSAVTKVSAVLVVGAAMACNPRSAVDGDFAPGASDWVQPTEKRLLMACLEMVTDTSDNLRRYAMRHDEEIGFYQRQRIRIQHLGGERFRYQDIDHQYIDTSRSSTEYGLNEFIIDLANPDQKIKQTHYRVYLDADTAYVYEESATGLMIQDRKRMSVAKDAFEVITLYGFSAAYLQPNSPDLHFTAQHRPDFVHYWSPYWGTLAIDYDGGQRFELVETGDPATRPAVTQLVREIR